MAKIVTITNPLTGQPAQVDQLDHTAQQIDDGLNIARGVSNPNLLDNWYFRNPINQRQGRIVKPNTTYYSDNQLTTAAGTTGAYVTAYRYATGTANGVNYASFKLEDSDTAPTYYAAPENVVRGYTVAGYGIDRWYLNISSSTAGGIQILDDCIQYIANGGTHIIEQSIEGLEDISGKTVTLSVLVDTFGLVSVTTALGSIKYKYFNGSTASDGYMSVEQKSSGIVSIVIGSNGTARKVYAAKLELGSQQTLAHQDANGNWVLNEIPDYGEQLRRCQYYSRFFGGDIEIPCSNNPDGTHIEGTLPLTMRSGSGSISYSDGFLFIGNGTFYTVTSANVYSNGGRVKIGVTVSGQLSANLQATLFLRNCSILFDV